MRLIMQQSGFKRQRNLVDDSKPPWREMNFQALGQFTCSLEPGSQTYQVSHGRFGCGSISREAFPKGVFPDQPVSDDAKMKLGLHLLTGSEANVEAWMEAALQSRKCSFKALCDALGLIDYGDAGRHLGHGENKAYINGDSDYGDSD